METLKQLIDQYCPDGVEYVRLGDVAEISRGTKQPQKMGNEKITLYSLPSFELGKPETVHPSKIKSSKILVDKSSLLVPKLNPRIPRIWLIPNPIENTYCSPEFFPIQSTSDSLSLRYLYYFMLGSIRSLADMVSGGSNSHKRLQRDQYMTLTIPLPPHKIQDKIVEYLDTLAALCDNLDAEIAQREKQFAEYREKLLSSDYLTDRYCADGVEYVRLGDVAENLDRLRKPVSAKDRQFGSYPYYGANGIQDWVHDFIFEGNFVLVGEDGSVVRKDGTPFVHWATGKIWVNNHAHVLVSRNDGLSLRFLYHSLRETNVSNFVTGSTQPKINQGNLNKILTPLPPREVQDELVSKLDTMQALIDNLRLEREQRQRQFDFYREKLLTFPQKETTEV